MDIYFSGPKKNTFIPQSNNRKITELFTTIEFYMTINRKKLTELNKKLRKKIKNVYKNPSNYFYFKLKKDCINLYKMY